ncbi:hypothetical protein PSEUBRA_003363 [Kalmanozyma brasiliensis GHG001]|uniref:Alcohol acetyltransferase n=1 Tax=Kalmanozyma brasiliensis (strain GHG001) TaxID=1365824 RepID=V5EXJ0_KALBG|nr:uncharacterized protein PSEUBRA_003363 [Kalmanozyma brasiliensis GHG001]EST07194.1 hypothetical protein PSEUBRA_003363 [Kalmanozyma brasiliensis GHG001]
MSTSTTPTRSLGLHERYAVSRRCVNSPSSVSAAAILQLDLASASRQGDIDRAFDALRCRLETRIDQAFAQYPLLGYCIQSPRAKAPRWSSITPTPTFRQILHTGAPVTKQAGAQGANKLLSQAILDDHISLPKSTNLEKGPLWKVTLSRIESEPACLVVLSTDHVINDGRGTLNLFRFLLQSQEPEATAAPIDPIPPASDKIFNFRPSIGYLLHEAFKELLLPHLPLPKKAKLKLQGPTSWPASPSPTTTSTEYDIVRTPKLCQPTLDILLITAPHLINNLKSLARTHVDPSNPAARAATLHSILHTLSLVALYAAVAVSHEANLDDFALVLGTATPISLREEVRPSKRRRGFPLSPSVEVAPVPLPFTSGNFVSSYADTYTLHPTTRFWAFTNDFATTLASPRGKSLARQHMGLLGFIPDFERSTNRKRKLDEEEEVDSSLGGRDEAYANGWEKLFGERAASRTPFDSAMTVSNLGLLDVESLGGDGWRVREATWAQSHTPQGEAFGLDVVGFVTGEEQTLSIGLSCRPSAFRDEELRKRFRGYLERLVRAFAVEPVHGKLSQETNDGEARLDLTQEINFAGLTRFLTSS